MNTEQIEALKLALEALEFFCVRSEDGEDLTPAKIKKAITALRRALEQPAEREPCGWRKKHNGEWVYAFSNDAWEFIRKGQPAIKQSLTTEQQEPVAFSQFLSDVMTAAGLLRHGKQSKALSERLGEMVVHYRARPQAREPLTDEQIKKIVQNEGFLSLQHFARAIEQAHGIKGDA